jgi:hypothetical protein
MAAIVPPPPAAVQAIFGPEAERLARASGFVRRRRRVSAAGFARVLSLVPLLGGRATLERLGESLGVTASAVGQRLRQPRAAQFLAALLRHAVERLGAAGGARPVAIPVLRRFRGVFLTDSTSLALPPGLARRFAGCGGGTGPDDPSGRAAVKVFLRLDLLTGRVADLLCRAGRTPDARGQRRLTRLPAGALSVADLGFFDSRWLRACGRRGVFWLTRLPARLSVHTGDGWQELADWLRDRRRRGVTAWEGPLTIGQKSPVAARVIVRRCPAAESARRRRKARARARRNGQTAGVRQLTLCDWWVLATNVPAGRLSADEAAAVYRARWQIELVFKRWKSLGHWAVDRAVSATHAECQLYARLVGVLVVDWLALVRGGPLAAASAWRTWQVVLDLVPLLLRALAGQFAWAAWVDEWLARLDRRRPPPRRRHRPSTRQRLLRATLKH